jgi:hypothetical protein
LLTTQLSHFQKTTMASSASDSTSLSTAFYTKGRQKCQRIASPPAVSRDDDSPPEKRVPDSPLLGEKDNRKNTPQAKQEDPDDDDPFDLKEQAKTWLANELKAAGDEKSSESFSPYNASRNDGTIPTKHWDKAYAEFHRRFVENTSSSGPSILLVATNVSKKWTPGEELLKAKYLFFPNIDYAGETLSALFITYMPGPEHGAADAYVNRRISVWWEGSPVLEKILNGGLSSGSYRNPQPDSRIFPRKKYKNHIGNDDVDKRNGNVPYSRLIWEVEWKNRSPLDIRRNGKVLMKSPYNRLYLAAKIYGVDDNDGKMEAAIVLWGREEGNGDGIKVMQAVSFGTKDLSEENKEDFAKNNSHCLVGVRTDEWLRPTDLPQDYPDTDETPQELMLNIPLKGILYKVSYKTVDTDEPRYLTELLGESKVTVPKLRIDLRKILRSVLDVIVTDEVT